MRLKKIDENKFILRLERGEEIIESIKKFCFKNNVNFGYFHGLGAVDKIELAHYRVDNKKYSSELLEDVLEILSLYGNITTMDNKIYLHSHIVVSNDKMQAFGGHLKEATISATCEIILVSLKGNVNRFHDKKIGLNMLDI